MVDLELPNDVLEILRQKTSMLKDELDRARQAKIDLDNDIEDINAKLKGIELLIQTPDNIGENSLPFSKSGVTVITGDVTKLPLGKAALYILKNCGKSMTASQIVVALKEAGRVMTGPNSRDMVTMSLKKRPKDQIQIRKDGQANRYKAK